MNQQQTESATATTVAPEPTLLEIIVQEHQVTPAAEIEVQVLIQTHCCSGWREQSRQRMRTVSGHIQIKPPGEYERIIITHV